MTVPFELDRECAALVGYEAKPDVPGCYSLPQQFDPKMLWYFLTGGFSELDPRVVVTRSCSNPRCARLSHISLHSTVNAVHSTLTEKQVLTLRCLYAGRKPTPVGCKRAAAKLGVKPKQIRDAVLGRTFGWLPSDVQSLDLALVLWAE